MRDNTKWIEIEPGVRFTQATLDREIRKSDLLLEKTVGKKMIDANTLRADLVVWRDRCAAALNPKVDVTRVESLAEAKAWDAEKSRLLNRGGTHAEAARLAWVKSNGY